MAFIQYSDSSQHAARPQATVVPFVVQMLETSGMLGLFCLMHLVAGLALWTSMVAAILLWTALNARCLQESDATLSQRFFGLRLDTPRELSARTVISYSFAVSGLGCCAWLVDAVVTGATGVSMSYRLTQCEIEVAAYLR